MFERAGEDTEMLLVFERGGESVPKLFLAGEGALREKLLEFGREGESVAIFFLAGEGALREGIRAGEGALREGIGEKRPVDGFGDGTFRLGVIRP